ncbi:TPA: site-specific DNA-methyltransferase [Pseudomonas aeruginosa]|uniref:DNA-methyltransferase n=1 Tax=Pseudomonas aeruginosa TaxID=287 RepID=UPI00192CFC2D|nr:site-specific DNA-methyltransferase [Pseudomonas aeruginosa]MBV5894996.1 site-specific DNA-methyltransferase [Pseudomonas aeruginosa]HCF5694173.1 site-specific DNA-methyltransferase [Pseudomonas aeruginosa]HEJ1612704.1 site-specific DNA-methyltransferase [Pseudomonas aeruginosa]HEJ4888232.1 site-specific DNA-methyltransferase [Pseudomonas aeruginosa]HEJ5515327.1 site-specific DNA-methyltransferase [Pseudomonas aeruginosa]
MSEMCDVENERLSFLDQSAVRSKSSSKSSSSSMSKPVSRGRSATSPSKPMTKANMALQPQVASQESFSNPELRKIAYYADDSILIFNMDVREAMGHLASAGVIVNCMVTSPPFYGQRDYGAEGQIGLEEHPRQFIEQLVDCFAAAKPVLAENGSLWVNLGDTYWSGKGEHRSGENKQSARRFGLRPQDRTGDGLLCKPKQLLLIPHRFAIAMQDDNWIVRNDNVWVKPNPIPDQVRDRCSMSHEYMFHLVKSRWYYFNKEAVGRRSSTGSVLPPPDTWEIPPARNSHNHKARFSEELVRIPILSTTPANGVVLDPFGGSGTSLAFARKNGFRAIGIDIKEEFCQLMVEQLAALK